MLMNRIISLRIGTLRSDQQHSERYIKMAEYRRIKGKDTWHFCKNCQHWPTSNFDSRTTRPGYDLCNECRSKERDGECKQ
jgi:RNase P subunit RPR2